MSATFDATKYERGLIMLLAKRAQNLGDKRPLIDIQLKCARKS